MVNVVFKVLSLLAFLTLSACATFHPQGKYGVQCKVSITTGPTTLEQLDCMDALGKDDPNYKPLTEKRQALFDAEVAMLTLTSTRYKNPIGGTIRAPSGASANAVKAKMMIFCGEHAKQMNYNVIEIKAGKDYLGQSGGSSAYCTQYGCYGSGSSSARYDYFNEVTFECPES